MTIPHANTLESIEMESLAALANVEIRSTVVPRWQRKAAEQQAREQQQEQVQGTTATPTKRRVTVGAETDPNAATTATSTASTPSRTGMEAVLGSSQKLAAARKPAPAPPQQPRTNTTLAQHS